METRKDEPKAKSLENYEKNLKLNLEAKRKDLDNITTSVIPSQLTLIRMFLWLSFSIVGAAFYAIKLDEISSSQFYFLSAIVITTVAIITLCLIAIKSSAVRLTANLDNAYFKDNIAQDDSEHAQGLIAMLDVTSQALGLAQDNVNKTGRILRVVTYLSFAVIFFISSFAIVSVYHEKGGENMAEEKKDKSAEVAKTVDSRPAFNQSTQIKPAQMRANSRNITGESQSGGFNITASKKPKQSDNANATDKTDEE
ncbi:hypothetical protein [uncultured Campylobacter sp.]|uniref:hypothetical protein n=1 Tax=uncultured Campylobacter sp. TaxID=218934 RepID=UPI00262C0F3C|nr:hypothetical protein [uncultured Campylobacter sp.]